jgi:hypothetical protein
MTETAHATSPSSRIPADDPNRQLTTADPDSADAPHVSVVGGLVTKPAGWGFDRPRKRRFGVALFAVRCGATLPDS